MGSSHTASCHYFIFIRNILLEVFNASKIRNDSKPASALTHYSTDMDTCAFRIESMFTHQFNFRIDEHLTVHLINSDYRPGLPIEKFYIRSISLEELLMDFCEHVQAYEIKGYVLNADKPLELNDCWKDDPIGSGGLEIIDLGHLSTNEAKELKAIFDPFHTVIYPSDIYRIYTRNDMKGIKKRYSSNNLFKLELKKRKQRSLAIGHDPLITQYHEIVWLHLTFRLKDWALSKGYDVFSYVNTSEGNGEKNYVTLKPGQVKEQADQVYRFDKSKYLEDALKLLPDYISDSSIEKPKNEEGSEVEMLWFGQSPMKYFTNVTKI